MISTSKAPGIALFALGFFGRTVLAQDVSTCAELITEVQGASTTATITLSSDISCTAPITVSSGQEITINGDGKTATINTGFNSDDGTNCLFENQAGGTMTLNDLSIADGAADALATGVRAIHNMGTLSVNNCVFKQLNLDATEVLTEGGAIYTASDGEAVRILNSNFESNYATEKGGAVFADGTDVLTVTKSSFKSNEAGVGYGGDIYAGPEVTLKVDETTFTDSNAELGGAAIECCGGTITGSSFVGAETSSPSTEHYGALLVGRPDTAECSQGLVMTNSTFTGCTVGYSNGGGGSVAIFDTSAEISDCMFETSQGTAVLFASSSADGNHKLEMTSCKFEVNTFPSTAYGLTENPQGTALVVYNSGVAEGADPVEMGEFFNMFCFANDPYECEFVYDRADIEFGGELKCNICNELGEKQPNSVNGDFVGSESVPSGSSDSSEGIVIGLSLALGLTLVVIGALAVWKFRVRKNARRLMEDMGEGDL